MKEIIILSFLLVSLACYSQNDKVLTLDKALDNAAPSCFAKPAQPPPSPDSITLKFFDGTAITNCIRPCGLARRYSNSVDSTGKPLSPRCYTTYAVLYILNGLPLVTTNLSGNDGVRICINDIQNIGILKPVEAEVLYGIIRKGGAVHVTTKCGQPGNDL